LPQHPNYCRPKSLNPKQETLPARLQYDRIKVHVAMQQTPSGDRFTDLSTPICAVTNGE
jgi:hypothetical protein